MKGKLEAHKVFPKVARGIGWNYYRDLYWIL